jgi:predicted TIM-barrel fold metal-dependent hydrolase
VVFVKLTAPYRLTASHPPYSDVDIFGEALIQANSSQLLWGSDWPFVVPLPGGPTGPYKNTGLDRPKPVAKSMYEVFRNWVDAETAHKILVENPQRLYQFD